VVSLPSRISSASPRLKRSSPFAVDVPSDQIGVSGCPGRSVMASALARSAKGCRASAAVIDGSTEPTMAAPNPAISSRRSGRKIRFVMPDADHFPLDMSSRRGYVPGGFQRAIFLLRTGGPML